MPTLHDILWDLRNDDLSFRLKLLGIKPRSPKKADLIDALKATLQNEELREIWTSLEDLEQAAVAETCYHTGLTHGLLDRRRLFSAGAGLPPAEEKL